MSSILLKYKGSLRKVNVSKSYSSVDLGHLISSIFNLKQKLSGVTDQVGKFYDLQHLSQNLRSFKSQTLALVTYKEVNEDNMSFASSYFDNVTPDKDSKTDIVETEQGVPEQIQRIDKGYFGHIEQQQVFESVFLEENESRVLVKTENYDNLPKINIPFYTSPAKASSVVIYSGTNKICELFVNDWQGINQKIQSVLERVGKLEPITKHQQGSKKKTDNQKPAKQSNRQQSGDYSFDPANKEVIVEQLQRRLESGDITELQFLRLKCQLHQHPEQFLEKYNASEKDSSIDDFRLEILRSREQRIRYQKVLNSFQKPSRQINNRSSEIPIIVRRNNNVIQKISTSYPISPEQEHSIHLIGELELKGLVSEAESKIYKSLVLYDNIEVYNIFSQYFNETIDQIELSKRLKSLKKYNQHQNRALDYDKPQPLSKLIQKACSPSNEELLTKLMIESNQKVLAAYDAYLLNRDDNLFGQTGDKIASYYRIKHDLDYLQEAGRFQKSKKRLPSAYKGANY